MAIVGNILYFYSKSESFFEFSNFYSVSFELDGRWWNSVQHYFQASKAINESDREMIRLCYNPIKAEILGNKIPTRKDWDIVKEDIMYKALKAKFIQNPNLKMMLLTTGNVTLMEKSPKDLYWGYKGKNRLGILLMKLRDELDITM